MTVWKFAEATKLYQSKQISLGHLRLVNSSIYRIFSQLETTVKLV